MADSLGHQMITSYSVCLMCNNMEKKNMLFVVGKEENWIFCGYSWSLHRHLRTAWNMPHNGWVEMVRFYDYIVSSFFLFFKIFCSVLEFLFLCKKKLFFLSSYPSCQEIKIGIMFCNCQKQIEAFSSFWLHTISSCFSSFNTHLSVCFVWTWVIGGFCKLWGRHNHVVDHHVTLLF